MPCGLQRQPHGKDEQRAYGLGISGIVATPLFGLGISGIVATPLFGLGISGMVATPLFGRGMSGIVATPLRVEATDIAKFIVATTMTAITTAPKRLILRDMSNILSVC
jgi:hypothetical protein